MTGSFGRSRAEARSCTGLWHSAPSSAHRSILFTATLTLSLGIPAPLLAAELSCPPSVALVVEAKEVPVPWSAFVPDEPHGFDHVTVYYRHPREMGSQVPDNEGSGRAPRWRVAGRSEEYWMACEYRGTDALLVQQLPPGVSQCAAVRNGLRCK